MSIFTLILTNHKPCEAEKGVNIEKLEKVEPEPPTNTANNGPAYVSSDEPPQNNNDHHDYNAQYRNIHASLKSIDNQNINKTKQYILNAIKIAIKNNVQPSMELIEGTHRIYGYDTKRIIFHSIPILYDWFFSIVDDNNYRVSDNTCIHAKRMLEEEFDIVLGDMCDLSIGRNYVWNNKRGMYIGKINISMPLVKLNRIMMS